MQYVVREKPSKLEELTFLKVRLWLVLWSISGTNIFANFGTGREKFSSFWTGIPRQVLDHLGSSAQRTRGSKV